MKLNRIYTIEIQTNPISLDDLEKSGVAGGYYTTPTPSDPERQIITIMDPLTVEFTVTTHLRARAHHADIVIYNLKKATRDLIYKDRLDVEGKRFYRQIKFYAGYEDKQNLIFQGNVQYAYSERHSVDWQTTIHAYDGGFSMENGIFSRTYDKEVSIENVLRDMIKSMPATSLRHISPIEGTMKKAVFSSGNPWNIITDIWTKDYGQAYIDREEVFLTKENEVIDGDIITISAESGLLETPKIFHTVIDVKMIFEPTLRIGQLIRLDSQVPECKGDHKIVGMNHSGIISGARSGEAITTLNLWDNNQEAFSKVILI